jgi:hypothetical protein
METEVLPSSGNVFQGSFGKSLEFPRTKDIFYMSTKPSRPVSQQVFSKYGQNVHYCALVVFIKTIHKEKCKIQ